MPKPPQLDTGSRLSMKPRKDLLDEKDNNHKIVLVKIMGQNACDANFFSNNVLSFKPEVTSIFLFI